MVNHNTYRDVALLALSIYYLDCRELFNTSFIRAYSFKELQCTFLAQQHSLSDCRLVSSLIALLTTCLMTLLLWISSIA